MRLLILISFILLFIYPFVLYPLVLKLAARRWPAAKGRVGEERFPTVALVICALNEEKIIRQKLENSLKLQYPGALHIVVVSDGSTDRTSEIVREFESAG